MTLAVPTYAVGAIPTYLAFVEEIRDLMDDDGYAREKIDRALRKAEAHFNRELRAPEMEASKVLTITAETTYLPADFLAMRAIFQEGSPDTPLVSMSPAGLLATYQGRSGTPAGYSIEGLRLRVAPVGATTLEMVYYQAIPALTDASVNNWLLRRHSDLYVAGVMFHLAKRERDNDGMAMAGQEVQTVIGAINSATQRARWGAGPLVPAGMSQVRGARA